jgi:hypothetical protein
MTSLIFLLLLFLPLSLCAGSNPPVDTDEQDVPWEGTDGHIYIFNPDYAGYETATQSSVAFGGFQGDILLGVACNSPVASATLLLNGWNKDDPKTWVLSKASFPISTTPEVITVPVKFPDSGSLPKLTESGWYNISIQADPCYEGILYGQQRVYNVTEDTKRFRDVVPVAVPIQGGTPMCDFTVVNEDASQRYVACDGFVFKGDTANAITNVIGTQEFEVISIDIRLTTNRLDDAQGACGPPLPRSIETRYYFVRDNYPEIAVNQKRDLKLNCAVGSAVQMGNNTICQAINPYDFPRFQGYPGGSPIGPHYFALIKAGPSLTYKTECPCLILRIMNVKNSIDQWTWELRVQRWDENYNQTHLDELNFQAKFGNDTAYYRESEWIFLYAAPVEGNNQTFNVPIDSERDCPGFIDRCPYGTVGCKCNTIAPLCNPGLQCSTQTLRCFDPTAPTPPPPTPAPANRNTSCTDTDDILECELTCTGTPGVQFCDCRVSDTGVVQIATCLSDDSKPKKSLAEKVPVKTIGIAAGAVFGVCIVVLAIFFVRRQLLLRRTLAELNNEDEMFTDIAKKYVQATTGEDKGSSGGSAPPTAHVNSDVNGWRCDTCMQMYDTSEDLRIHQTKRGHGNAAGGGAAAAHVNSDANGWMCPVCQQTYEKQEDLAFHQNKRGHASAASTMGGGAPMMMQGQSAGSMMGGGYAGGGGSFHSAQSFGGSMNGGGSYPNMYAQSAGNAFGGNGGW